MMQRNRSENQQVSNSDRLFKPSALSLFIASVAVIFVAEALVMLLIGALQLPSNFALGFIDAALLSVFVIPTLYFMLFKPMRETIDKLDQSEKIQNQLQEIDQLKSDFISIASHEMCTPITTISGYAEILLEETESTQQKEYLEIILKKTRALERIIDDLGVVNRFETGDNLQIRKEQHDLLQTVRDVCNIYRSRFPDKSINLHLPEPPLMLRYDEVRMSQVLDNLLSNAVKYSHDIHDEIDVLVEDQGEHVLLRVKDEGIGMTEDELKLIYNKFFRAQGMDSVVGGLGLGMAIVKNIVENHAGTIDIISQKKVGTTVSVTLPRHSDSVG